MILITKFLIFVLTGKIITALHCGENSVRKIKVVGGKNVLKHEFPWQASIRWRVGMMKGDHVCGGSLIHMKYVLTAAHCFAHGNDPTYYNVTLGSHNRELEDPLVQNIEIEKIILHEEYGSPVKFNNDIALIELKRPARFSAAVNIICLPTFVDFELPNKMCVVTGWGKTSDEDDPLPKILQKAEVPIVKFSTCDSKLSYNGKLTRNMFCAGYQDGRKDACSGDSGGPIQCMREHYYTLQGVTSFGEGCGTANKYGVYTVVRHYLKWISEKSKGLVRIPIKPPPKKPPPPPPPPPIPPNKMSWVRPPVPSRTHALDSIPRKRQLPLETLRDNQQDVGINWLTTVKPTTIYWETTVRPTTIYWISTAKPTTRYWTRETPSPIPQGILKEAIYNFQKGMVRHLYSLQTEIRDLLTRTKIHLVSFREKLLRVLNGYLGNYPSPGNYTVNY